jgi:hypothetical protein
VLSYDCKLAHQLTSVFGSRWGLQVWQLLLLAEVQVLLLASLSAQKELLPHTWKDLSLHAQFWGRWDTTGKLAL